MSSDQGGAGLNVPVVPFSPDGGCSPVGWGLMLGASTAVGLVMGLVAGFVSQWFYLVLLFPLGMGALIGLAGITAIQQGKVRSPWLTVFAACLGGGATVLGMHYCQYLLFLADRDKEVGPHEIEIAEKFDELRRNPGGLEEHDRDLVQSLQENPRALAWLRVKSLWDFIDFAAEEGVTISRARGGGDKGINLGYTGSYVYWGVEWAIIAGVAMAMMWPAASEPFCLGCQNWNQWQPLGCLTPDPFAAKNALSSGDLGAWGRLSPVACAGHYMVAAAICPRCGEQASADLKLEEVTVNEKNETVRKNLLQVTYPGEALPMIRKMFDDGAARAIAEAEAAKAEAAGEAPPGEGQASG